MTQINCLRCKQPIDIEPRTVPRVRRAGDGVPAHVLVEAASTASTRSSTASASAAWARSSRSATSISTSFASSRSCGRTSPPTIRALQRFLQEARTSTMIKHKNLAMLYDFAQLDDGSYYMVWEFIDGTNIQKWIAPERPDAAAAGRRDLHSGAERTRPSPLDGPHPSRHLAREHHAVAGPSRKTAGQGHRLRHRQAARGRRRRPGPRRRPACSSAS